MGKHTGTLAGSIARHNPAVGSMPSEREMKRVVSAQAGRSPLSARTASYSSARFRRVDRAIPRNASPVWTARSVNRMGARCTAITAANRPAVHLSSFHGSFHKGTPFYVVVCQQDFIPTPDYPRDVQFWDRETVEQRKGRFSSYVLCRTDELMVEFLAPGVTISS
jgi:hypothetical protein